MKTTRKTREPAPATRRLQRLIVQELRHYAEQTFKVPVIENWAKKAGLYYGTVYKLLRGDTKFVQFNTLVRLADVVGQELYLQDRGRALIVPKHAKGKQKRALTTVLR